MDKNAALDDWLLMQCDSCKMDNNGVCMVLGEEFFDWCKNAKGEICRYRT